VGIIVLALGAAAFVNARRFQEWVDLALGIGAPGHHTEPPRGPAR
jgi:hypothetical protein